MAEDFLIVADSIEKAREIALERAETHKKTAFYATYSGAPEHKYSDFESRITVYSKAPSLYTAYYLHSDKNSRQLLFVITSPVENAPGGYQVITYYNGEAEDFLRKQSA